MSGSSAHSDTATQVVSSADRMSPGSLTMVWWSLCSAMFYLFLGATLALTFGTANALTGAALGAVAMSVLGYVFSRYAIRTGRSCYLLSRELFGTAGAALATLIFAVTAVYYALFESSVVAVAASKVLPRLGYVSACLLIVGYSVLFITGSVQQWLDKLNALLLPVYLLGLAAAVVLAIRHYGYSSAWLSVGPPTIPPYGWWICCMAYFGLQLLMMCTLDFARFGRTADNGYLGLFAFGLPFYVIAFLFNAVVGIFLAAEAGLANVSETVVMDVCLAVLGGPVGLFFVWATQTRINTANYFLSATNVQAFFRDIARIRLPRVLCAVIVGALVLAFLLSTNVLKYILIAVNYQAVILTAWVGVALAYIVSKGRSSRVDVSAGGGDDASPQPPVFSATGLIAWTASAAIGLATVHAGGGIATLSVPVTLAVAVLGYWLPTARSARRP
jgi:purine-cytosine permease-like protein